jgi:hypothetical protein
MKFWTKQRFLRIIRAVHRDLGYLMVGVSLVYAISGILLNHMDGKDPAYKTEAKSVQLERNLNREELSVRWSDKKGLPVIRKIFPVDKTHTRLMLEGGVAIYNSATGLADYEIHTQRRFVYWINRLHYNRVAGWSIVADFFAASLIFFAISGLAMVKGKKGISGKGKWYLLAGLAVPIAYILITQ